MNRQTSFSKPQTRTLTGILFCALLFCTGLSPLFASGSAESRNYLSDTRKAAEEKLTEDQEKVATFVFDIYSGIYGYREGSTAKNAQKMTDEEYENTVTVAAKVAVNPVAKGLLSAGELGQKTLKALVVAAEDGAKSAGSWIDKKSQEYDSRRK
ncbi:MAG: hypothetical protein LBU99_01655 [Spirochaetaceae bacterium]|jgi:hypothetical protein|nr:hypothetical protein [Spirochaetaceae bacterium]